MRYLADQILSVSKLSSLHPSPFSNLLTNEHLRLHLVNTILNWSSRSQQKPPLGQHHVFFFNIYFSQLWRRVQFSKIISKYLAIISCIIYIKCLSLVIYFPLHVIYHYSSQQSLINDRIPPTDHEERTNHGSNKRWGYTKYYENESTWIFISGRDVYPLWWF